MKLPSAFELDIEAPDWLESILTMLLEVGVPPTALARAFKIEPDAVKALQSTLHIQKYGTDEISEAMFFLLWQAYEEGQNILHHAPSQQRQRFITVLLSRQSMIIGKESPQALANMRAELESLIASVGVEDPVTPSIYANSEFTPVDRETDDSEEGLEG